MMEGERRRRVLEGLEVRGYMAETFRSRCDTGHPDRAEALCANPRVAIFSTSVPPAPSGQSRALSRLFAEMPVDSRVLISENLDFLDDIPSPEPWGHYIRSPSGARYLSGNLLTAYGKVDAPNEFLGFFRTITIRAVQTSRALQQFSPRAIVACSGSYYDLPVAMLVAAWLRVPLIAYLFDDPVLQWQEDAVHQRLLARVWEPLWMRCAAHVVVPNEFHLAILHGRHPSLAASVIRNPVSHTAFTTVTNPWPLQFEGTIRIAYTGSVYEAQGGAFRTLLEALHRLDGRFELHIYTAQSGEELAREGVAGPHVVRHDHLEEDQIYRVQHEADILFLPLAFASKLHEVVMVSSPGKMGEYLVSGRPILVHAPRGSFVSSFFRSNDCGVVVDEPSAEELVRALNAIAASDALRDRVVANASITGREFDAQRCRKLLSEILDSSMQRWGEASASTSA